MGSGLVGWYLKSIMLAGESFTLSKLGSPWGSLQGQQDPKCQHQPSWSLEAGGCLAKLCSLERVRTGLGL